MYNKLYTLDFCKKQMERKKRNEGRKIRDEVGGGKSKICKTFNVDGRLLPAIIFFSFPSALRSHFLAAIMACIIRLIKTTFIEKI